jgi:hypothetical protein
MPTELAPLLMGQAFASTRTFVDLARFHVDFDAMVGGADIDGRLRRTLERNGRVAVLGRPGAGKSSLLASLLSPPPELGHHYAPVRLSIGGESRREHLGDPRHLGGRIIADLAANYLEPADAIALRERGAPIVHISGPSETVRSQVGNNFAQLSREVRQAAESFDVERTQAEVLAAVSSALEPLVQLETLTPVLLLEDADGLLNLPRVAPNDRPDIANEFFGFGLTPLLQALEIPVLIAAQPRYQDLDGFHAFRSNMLDVTVDVPAPSGFAEHGVRLLLSRAIAEAGSARSIDSVFEASAMTTLLALRYSIAEVRTLVSVCRVALVEADGQGRDSITEADIAYGMTQVLHS